ncbi:MAG TPA: sulfate ABC transporter substrate-binding protein [Actinomycetota bacterium]|nr:sulfate ABC transporter substrate-binding protein [Actinomycetota bacterium]
MAPRHPGARALGLVAAAAVLASACASNANGARGGSGSCTPQESPVITLAAYSNVYDVYGKLISNFQTEWKDSHDGQQVIFQTSFGGSTTQAQNVVNGFPADIVALSLAPDVQMIEDAGLIAHDWTQEADSGIVATSIVVFDVRPGNPKHIENWDDLTQPGLEILTPDPAQSGGARWNIVAAYGAAMRGNVPGYDADDPAAAKKLLEGIFANVSVMDKSANDSIKNFQSGNGDVAITYEYAVLAAQNAGLPDEAVIPPSTVSIQTPVAVVDTYAEQHCVEDIANAFVEYLHTKEAKELFSSAGYERSVNLKKAKAGDGGTYAAINDLFTVDDLGGWDKLQSDTVFGPEGAFTQAQAAVTG